MNSRTPSGINKFVSATKTFLNGHPSMNSAQEDWRKKEPQCISGEYVVPKRLEAALKRKWKNEYAVEMRSNEYRIRAPGRLSDAEIVKCYSLGY